ncbi:MAG: Smr/MutS family protein [Myxococcota bacterium]
MSRQRRIKAIDLHGEGRWTAVQELNDELDRCDDARLLVITGRGRHSPGGRPVIKPLVEAFLNRNGYWRHWHDGAASGAVTVDLEPPPDRD